MTAFWYCTWLNVSLIYLALNASVPDKSTFYPEFVYNLNNTILVFRDPLQTIEYNATVSCHLYVFDYIRCLLHNINIYSTLKYKNFDILHEVVKQRLSTEDWFDIKFNARGVERIFTKDSSNIKDLIKKTAYQFSIGNDLEDRTFSSPDVSGFVNRGKN